MSIHCGFVCELSDIELLEDKLVELNSFDVLYHGCWYTCNLHDMSDQDVFWIRLYMPDAEYEYDGREWSVDFDECGQPTNFLSWLAATFPGKQVSCVCYGALELRKASTLDRFEKKIAAAAPLFVGRLPRIWRR